MNQKTRSLLFFFLILIFLVVAPLTVLYSQGYRVDFQNLRVVQTGGFYFRVTPPNVNIIITPERENLLAIEDNTNFFFGTLYVENILPERYAITISKEGYHPWRKSLEIREKKVTEVKNVTLIPTDPSFTITQDQISDIFLLSDRREIIIKRSINDKEWDLMIYDPVRDLLEPLLSFNDVPGEPSIVLSSPRRQELLIDMGTYHLVINPINRIRHTINDIISPLLHPGQANSIIHLDNGNLVSYNYLSALSSILAEEVKAFGIRENGDIVWLSRDGILFENGERIQSTPFPIRDGLEYQILLPNQSDIAIVENNSFHFLDRNRFEFTEMFRSDQKPIPSPDRKKLAYYSAHEINILYLEDTTDQPAKKHGEISFLTRFSGKVNNVGWLNNHYLVFSVDGDIKVIEIDDRDHINIVNLANLNNPKLHFERSNNRLYVLSDGNLLVSRMLLP